MHEQPISRKRNIVVTLTVIALFVVIGASALWFAVQLHFIPFLQSAPAPVVQRVATPNLIQDTLSQAQDVVRKLGLHLAIASGSPKTGIVTNQSPTSPSVISPGTTITVTLAQASS